MNAPRIRHQHLFGDICRTRHHQELAAHQIVELVVLQYRPHGPRDIFTRRLALIVIEVVRHIRDEMPGHQFLHGLVTGEGIVILFRKKNQLFARYVPLDRHRRRERPVDRQDRLFGKAIERHLGAILVENHKLFPPMRTACTIEQSELERDGHRLLFALAWSGGNGLRQREPGRFTLVLQCHADPGRSGPRIPAAEPSEI